MRKILLSVIPFLFLIAAQAQFGALDVGFDTDGIQTTDINGLEDIGYDIAIQNDGKLIVVGTAFDSTESNFVILRYLSNGSLDSTFGGDGIVTIDFDTAAQSDAAHAVAIQPDGKIVVAGCATTGVAWDYDFGIARLNADGTMDTSFDTDGMRMISLGLANSDNEAYDVKIDANGKILTAGYIQTASSGKNFALYRMNADGSTDTTFGNAGLVSTNFSGLDDIAYSLTILNDGRILAGGSIISISTTDYGLALYHSNGTADVSFSSDGKLNTDFGASHDVVWDVIQQGDGKLLAVGSSIISGNHDFSMARYTLTGQLDTSFNDDGKNVVDVYGSSDEDEAMVVTIQPDNYIVVGGYAFTGTDQNLAMLRFDYNGELDGSFGTGGIVTTDIASSPNDIISGMAIQPADLKLVVAGTSGPSFVNRDIAIARYTTGMNIGIAEFGIDQDVLLYPNPVTETAIIRYTLLQDEILSVNLQNVHGQRVQTYLTNEHQSLGDHQIQIELPADMESGIYFITMSTGSGSIVIKIMH